MHNFSNKGWETGIESEPTMTTNELDPDEIAWAYEQGAKSDPEALDMIAKHREHEGIRRGTGV